MSTTIDKDELLWMLHTMTNINIISTNEITDKFTKNSVKIVEIHEKNTKTPIFLTIGKDAVVISDKGRTLLSVSPETKFSVFAVEKENRRPHFDPDNMRSNIINATVASILGDSVTINNMGEMAVYVKKSAQDILSGCFYLFTVISEIREFDKLFSHQEVAA